jgi:hypothetical protein
MGPKIITLEINYAVHDGTLLNTFINPSTTGMRHLRIMRLNCCKYIVFVSRIPQHYHLYNTIYTAYCNLALLVLEMRNINELW